MSLTSKASRVFTTAMADPNAATEIIAAINAATVGIGATATPTYASLVVTAGATVGTTLGVTGAATFSSTINVTGTATLAGALAHTGSTVGFYATAPVTKGVSIAAATDAASAITQLNLLITAFRRLGFIA